MNGQAHQEPYVICQEECGSNEIEDLTIAVAGLTQTDDNFVAWNGPYMNIIPTDPWGNNYFFDDIGGGDIKAVVGSYGPNGQGLNLYDEDDILCGQPLKKFFEGDNDHCYLQEIF